MRHLNRCRLVRIDKEKYCDKDHGESDRGGNAGDAPVCTKLAEPSGRNGACGNHPIGSKSIRPSILGHICLSRGLLLVLFRCFLKRFVKYAHALFRPRVGADIETDRTSPTLNA